MSGDGLALNSNDIYVSINQVDVSAFFTDEISRNVSINLVDITHGAGQGWTQQAQGLKGYELTLSLIYTRLTYRQIVVPVMRAAIQNSEPLWLTYGPEGKAAGRPVDELLVNLSGVEGPNPSIEKEKLMVQYSFVSAEAPVRLVDWGSVFA